MRTRRQSAAFVQQAHTRQRAPLLARTVRVARPTSTATRQRPVSHVHLGASRARVRPHVKGASQERWITTHRLRLPAFCAHWVSSPRMLRRAARDVQLVSSQTVKALHCARRVVQGSIWTPLATMRRRTVSAVRVAGTLMSLGVIRPQTALRAMLVGMELVAARRVSARVSVRLVGTRHHRVHLVRRRWTALRAMLVGMELVAARPVSAQVTVSLVGTRHHRQLLVHRHRTASRVLRARMSTRLAVAVWRAVSTVLWGHMLMSMGVVRPQTALRVMLVGTVLRAVQAVSVQVTAVQVDTHLETQRRVLLQLTASDVLPVDM